MNLVFGGQAGSEAKGKMSAYLVDKFDIRVVAGNFSPNAGHTVIRDGVKHVTYHIPAGVWGARDLGNITVVLGPESIINPDVFLKEVEELKNRGFNRRNLIIDSRAAIVTPWMIRGEERLLTGIGSTAQGVGEARCAKIRRIGCKRVGGVEELYPYLRDESNEELIGQMEWGNMVLYEMTQGFDLCMAHGVDPTYCTSRNCTPMQGLADAGVPAKWLGDVYAVIRPYPIRVNNRTGSSGPYPSEEITWDEVARRCGAPGDITELTTTTKLKRRVFEFSWSRIMRMVRVCNPTYLCLQFANYLDWRCYGRPDPSFGGVIKKFVKELQLNTGVPVAYLGTGPGHASMMDREVDNYEN